MTHGQSDTIPGRRPIVVPGPEPITPLQAALAALNADITSKPLYLESSPHAALRDYVAELEGGMGFHWLIMHWFENNPAAYAAFKRSLDND